MASHGRSRQWWEQTVGRWRRSGLTAAEFAAREKLRAGTLRWWSSQLKRDTRAKHGWTSRALVPIEIAVPGSADGNGEAAGTGRVEVCFDGSVVQFEVGTDVNYVSSLVQALRRS